MRRGTGTSFADRIKGARGTERPAMGHLMGAIRLDEFRDPKEIQKEMDATYDIIRNAKKEPGEDKVYIHGEPEAMAIEENTKLGPITPAVYEQLKIAFENMGLMPFLNRLFKRYHYNFLVCRGLFQIVIPSIDIWCCWSVSTIE